MIRGIMFDFDGTLTSAEVLRRIFSHVETDSKSLAPKLFWDTMLRFYVRNQELFPYGKEFREYFHKETGITIQNDFYKSFKEGKVESPLRPGLRQLLAVLSKNCKLGVFTGINPEKKRRILRDASLFSYFTEVYPLQGDVPKKPHPAAFRHAESHFGITGAEVLLVDDNPVRGILGAKLYGWKTCFLNECGTHFEFPLGLAPDYEIKSLDELPGLLAKMK